MNLHGFICLLPSKSGGKVWYTIFIMHHLKWIISAFGLGGKRDLPLQVSAKDPCMCLSSCINGLAEGTPFHIHNSFLLLISPAVLKVYSL